MVNNSCLTFKLLQSKHDFLGRTSKCSFSLAYAQAKGPRGRATIQVHFDQKDCSSCAERWRCTRSEKSGRQLTFPLQAQYEALLAACKHQDSPSFKKEYAARSGIEGTLSQAVFSMGMRRSRYRGKSKTHLQHIATAAAINVQRIIDWLCQTPRSKTHVGHFANLAIRF